MFSNSTLRTISIEIRDFINQWKEQSKTYIVHFTVFPLNMGLVNQNWVLNKVYLPFLESRKPLRRERNPDGVHLMAYPFYMILVNENRGFKNISVNRPFS